MEVFFIGGETPHACDLPVALIGSKASGLARLARADLRVPPAFVLGTDICREALRAGGRLPPSVRPLLRDAVARLERASLRQFGGDVPLLVSVRSSPPVSMPGMLETVLNVGLTDAATRGLLRTTGNPILVWDTSRRFAEAFAETVLGCPAAPFARNRDRFFATAGARSVDDLDPLAMRDLARESSRLVQMLSDSPLPDDPWVQLEAAIEAVFRSWSTPRAVEYRRLSHLDGATGTGVVVQAMVFGNGSLASGSGVGFTRDPSTGVDELYVDFLFNAQGEDVVSGRRRISHTASLFDTLPDVHGELLRAKTLLEQEFADMQDFEFTLEEGRLYFLQSRAGKRTPWAALQIAVDLVRGGVIEPEEAERRLADYDLDAIHRGRLAPGPGSDPIASSVTAGLGVATGAIVFDSARAQAAASTGPVILVRPDITTDDVAGLAAATGILTARGGRTSHAAVVARHLGKVCLVGCASLDIDDARRRCSLGARSLNEGDVITLDGDSGAVYAGAVPARIERPEAALETLRQWRRAPSLLPG